MTPPPGRHRWFCRLCLPFIILSGIVHASAPTRSFDIPAGDADKMLQRFAVQSGVEVLFSTEAAKGVQTNAIKGTFAVEDAVRRMLSGTPLYLVNDAKNGVLRIARAPHPNAPRAAQRTTCGRPEKSLTNLPHPYPKT
jgi:hypothetical protein